MIPSVLDLIGDFQTRLTFARVNKTIGDYDINESSYSIKGFAGVIEPIPETKLWVKPEGQRKWKWFRLWTQESLNLDDYIKDLSGKQYRIMTKSDWNLGGGQFATGVQEYQITESSSLGSEAA